MNIKMQKEYLNLKSAWFAFIENTCTIYILLCTYCVFGGLPGLHFADVLHVLKLAQLGQSVVTQGLVQWRVSVLVLHIQICLSSHQELDTNRGWNLTSVFSAVEDLIMFNDADEQAYNDI